MPRSPLAHAGFEPEARLQCFLGYTERRYLRLVAHCPRGGEVFGDGRDCVRCRFWVKTMFSVIVCRAKQRRGLSGGVDVGSKTVVVDGTTQKTQALSTATIPRGPYVLYHFKFFR